MSSDSSDKTKTDFVNIFGDSSSFQTNTQSIFGDSTTETVFGTFQTTKEEKKEEKKEEQELKEEEECKAQFTPQVNLDLLPEIDVKTLEEDEDVLYKVYVFVKKFF